MFEKYTHCVFVFVSVFAMNFSSQYKTKKKKMKRKECPERLLVMGYQLRVKKAQQKVSLILSFDCIRYFDLF